MRSLSGTRLAPAWLLLALLPWWLGLPWLLAVVAVLLVAGERLQAHAPWLRAGLRWGLPGVLLAVVRVLGGDALAWAMTLLGVLVGYTLLAGLDAWLDRRQVREPLAAAGPDWPALALARVGPGPVVVQLQPPQWCQERCADPRGGEARWQAGAFRLADGTVLERVSPEACFSPDGRWFVARTHHGLVLLDRDADRPHRLRGWALCGWHEGPWLARRSGPAMAWWEVLG